VKLQTRLLLTLAPLAAALVVIGVVSLRTFDALGRSSQRILQDNYRSVLAAQRMKESAERIDSAALFRAAGRADKADEQAPPNLDSFERELEIEAHNLTEQGEEQAADQLLAIWKEYRSRYTSYTKLTSEAELKKVYFEEMEPGFLRLKRAADHILEINQDAMVRKSEEARREAEQQRSLLLFTLLAALGMGMFASISLTSRALRPLRALSGVVRKIGEGDLDARAKLSGEDEISRVGRELDVMADRLREYRNSSLGELLQAQQASQAAIDSLPDPVLVLSVDGSVLNVNQAA
jgi:NtrC-family two-component system sensor histidine kinase KinB